MLPLKLYAYLVVLCQSVYLVCTVFQTYCPPPASNVTGAEKTFVKYYRPNDPSLPLEWYASEVRYACNAGLGPHLESVCKYTYTTNIEVDWIPPIEDLLQLNCSASNYTDEENAMVFGNSNLQGRPWIVADDEAYDILKNIVFGPKRAMRNSSGDAAYGPSSNYRNKQLTPASTSVNHGYWLNGNRLYPDADTCDTVAYCTDDVIELKGPGDHIEILDGSWAVPVTGTDGVYDIWTSADGINTNMCLLAWSQESFNVTGNAYNNITWMETVFCDQLELTSTFSNYPFTMPVICELLVWPSTCGVPSMSADVVLMDGSSPVVSEINVGVPLSIKCSQPAAYVVADGQSYTQLDINCIQSKFDLPYLSHNVITCAQIGCGNLTVSQATVVGNQTKPELGFVVGEVATVVCNEGYDTELKNANSVMCILDNSTANTFTLKWNMTIPECVETSYCKQENLSLPCGGDRFIFLHKNGTETQHIYQATYPHGTKVHTECHLNCQGQSEQGNPTGMRECRFGKWHGCFHKCTCPVSATNNKCLQLVFRRGWSDTLSATVEWRRYANPSQCCHICSLHNRHDGTTNENDCAAFNMRYLQYGVECQFFNQNDTTPVVNYQYYYYSIYAV